MLSAECLSVCEEIAEAAQPACGADFSPRRRDESRPTLISSQTLSTQHSALSHHPNTYANTSGATIDASDSMTCFGVSMPSFPHVIFSFGTAPEYEP